MRAVLFLLRRRRAELAPMLLLAAVVAATSFVATAAPRGFTRIADEGLRAALLEARPLDRNMELGRVGVLRGGEGMDPVATAGEEIRAALPDSVRELIKGSAFHAESANWSIVRDPDVHPAWLRFRFGPAISERVTFVDGRAPTGATSTVPGAPGTLPGEPEDATLFEVALAVDIAETLGVGVGDRLELVPDTDDVLVGQFSSPVRAAADVVGIYRVDDPDDEFWMDDPAMQLPTVIVVSLDLQLLYGTALLSDYAYPALIAKGLPARYAWRQFIDADRLDAGRLEVVTADLRRMLTQYPPFVVTQRDPDTTTLRTGLLDVLDGFAAERRTAEAVLTAAALGPLAVAGAALVLLAMLIVTRRGRAAALVAGRGGSVLHWAASHAVEAIMVAGPAAAVGASLAWLVVAARPTSVDVIAPAAVAATAVAVLAAVAARQALRGPAASDRGRPRLRSGPRRLVAESLVVGIAGLAAYLLRERGLAGAGAGGRLDGADPLLAAVPALVGLAVAVVAARVYPWFVRAGDWLADGWRGAVPAIGLRRASRSGEIGSLPLVVLLVTVAIGAFSSTVSLSIERGQEAATWQEVGADFAIDPGSRPIPSELDATTLPGVEAAARVHATGATIGGRGGQRVELVAIDIPAHVKVTRGTGADPQLPVDLRSLDLGEGAVPVVLSRRAAELGSEPLRAGDEGVLLVGAREVPIRVVSVRDRFPGIDRAAPWIVAPLDMIAAVTGRASAPTSLLVRAPAISRDELQAAVDAVLPATTVTARDELLAARRAAALPRGVGIGFVLAIAVALGYAVLATSAALVLVARMRRGESAQLRTLGLSHRQLLGLTLVEYGPAVVAATAIGVGLGVGVAWFIGPSLGLAGLIGSPIEVVPVVEWGAVALLLAGLLVVLAASVTISARIAGGADLARAARQGIE